MKEPIITRQELPRSGETFIDRRLQLVPAFVSSFVSSLPRGNRRAAHFLGRRLGPREFTLADGLKMKLDPSDPFQAEMAFDVYQRELAEEMLGLVNPTDVVLTAGAHVGYLMLKLALRTKRVVGFECDPNLVNLCQQNLDLNQLNVTLVPVGLGSEEDELEMNISKNLGQSSFSIPHYSVEKAMVKVRRGDDALRELGISHIDGLLLDLEGWESHALEGLSETLKDPPRWAIIECFDVALENAGSSRQTLLSQIENIGLRVDKTIDGDLVCLRP